MKTKSAYTLNNILDPFGAGISAFNKTLIIDTYMKKFLEAQRNMKINVSTYEKDIYVHVKYPSDNKYANGVYYDVVFQFENDDTKPILEIPVKVFSNSPSFMYTYTYAWKFHGGLSEPFVKKCSQIALTEAPIRKNPNLILGFDESLWMSAQYIKSLNIRRIGNILKLYPVLSFQSFFNNIKSQEDKKQERDIVERQNRTSEKNKKVNKLINEHLLKKGSKGSKGSIGTKKINKSSKVERTKSIGTRKLLNSKKDYI